MDLGDVSDINWEVQELGIFINLNYTPFDTFKHNPTKNIGKGFLIKW